MTTMTPTTPFIRLDLSLDDCLDRRQAVEFVKENYNRVLVDECAMYLSSQLVEVGNSQVPGYTSLCGNGIYGFVFACIISGGINHYLFEYENECMEHFGLDPLDHPTIPRQEIMDAREVCGEELHSFCTPLKGGDFAI